MTATIDTVAAFEGRTAMVQGPARSGKTEALVRRTAQLIERGADPASILVAVTSGFAAQAFRQRLRRALSAASAQAASDIAVLTPLNACVQVLASPAAREATGRTPRLLTSAEYNFFLEDMKTTGEAVRKLRSGLAVLWRQMASGQPEAEWQLGSGEKTLFDHARRVLKMRDAMLDQEAPAIALAYLRSDAGAQEAHRYAHVLADDFPSYSAAEQMCLCLLAKDQLIVAGNPNEVQPGRPGHAYAPGFSHFASTHESVEAFTLEGAFGNPAVVAFADALCGQNGMDRKLRAGEALDRGEAPAGAFTSPSGVQSIKWNTPDDELQGLTKYLRALADKHEVLHEHRICVVVPNRRWASMAERMLRRRGFAVSSAGAFPGLSGDPRDTRRCAAMLSYTKLNLLADPHDMVAWRSWCGFNNPLTNSDAWDGLQNFADERGMSLYDALESLGNAGFGAKERFPRANVLAERWRKGQDFILKNGSRKGFGLLKAIGAESMTEFAAAEAAMIGSESATELYDLVRTSITDPTWPDDPHTLHVSALNTLAGTEYDVVFVLGAIDGFIPQRNAFEVVSTDEQRNRIKNAERRTFTAGVAKANTLLVLSHFAKAPLELAEKSKMQVARVKSEQGDRMAMVRPSCFIAEAGAAAPTTTGGQALMAEHGLN